MPSPPRITKLTLGRYSSSLGIGESRPSLSWRFEQDDSTEKGWKQENYELSFTRNGKETTHKVDSSENVEVPWPKDEPGLKSREQVEVRVRAGGDWYSQKVEAALLDSSDWSASVIGPDIPAPANLPKRPFYLRRTFNCDSSSSARIYATALGVYEINVNGKRVGDHVMAPGWQSYNHRLHYQTYKVDNLVKGDNTIEIVVGEGWYSGRLTWMPDMRNIWGKDIGVMIQLEMEGKSVLTTDDSWEWSYGNLLSSELYDGESYDANLNPTEWRSVKIIPLLKTNLIAPEAPPIRRIEDLKPIKLITTPSGKKILDFGQNFVGWVKIKSIPKASRPNETITLRYAEVLDKGEMGMRPLRSAKVTDRIYLGEAMDEWEPKFTTHGFRYCEVSGPGSLLENYESTFIGVVIHSDMERIGDFTCSHEMVNKLHQNVVWGLRGNFVGLPTDCPQRDERLGWTGDLQAFAPTASLLYDTAGFLANWLHDLSAEQLNDNKGVVPLVVPNTLSFFGQEPLAQAVWGDVCVITPKDLYQAYGSKAILEEMWKSITTWLDKGIPRGENGLWLNPRDGFQLSDWLDPRAPPDDPGAALTDQFLVADAYLVSIHQTASIIAKILGNESESSRYAKEHSKLRSVFQEEYLTPSGRLSSDTQTAYTLAYQFGLLDDKHLKGASERLVRLVTRGDFRIATGFAGTPGILHALTEAGHLQVAYRMLQEKGCPSWLYPVTMGATTVWERWDSLLPDGSINPGEMTSFNHYALGAVANWLHTTVGGLKPLSPGYKRFQIQPRPGGTLTTASVHTITPYGRAAVSWVLKGTKLNVEFEIPPNTTAIVKLGGKEEELGSGKYSREVEYQVEKFPPDAYVTKFSQKVQVRLELDVRGKY